MNTYAEVGINHLGDEQYALDLVKNLINTDISGVTIQFRDKEFYKKYSKFILNDNLFNLLKSEIKSKNKLFGVAIKDPDKINFFDEIQTDFYKVIENDLKNDELIEKILKSSAKKVYISTGMSDSNEIKKFLRKNKKIDKKKIIFIHTTLSNKVDKVNLEAIQYLKEKFSVQVAYGNHCENYKSMLLSLTYHPESIFFYVKGNKYKKHPDEEYAININFVQKLVEEINLLKLSIGEYSKEKIYDIIPEKSVQKL